VETQDKLFELMSKMYEEMQEGFKEVKGEIKEVKIRLDRVEDRLDKVENTVIKIEQDNGKKLSALFDGHEQNSRKLDRIEKEVSKHEEVILRRIR